MKKRTVTPAQRELIKTYLLMLLHEAKKNAFQRARTPEQIKLAFPASSLRIQ